MTLAEQHRLIDLQKELGSSRETSRKNEEEWKNKNVRLQGRVTALQEELASQREAYQEELQNVREQLDRRQRELNDREDELHKANMKIQSLSSSADEAQRSASNIAADRDSITEEARLVSPLLLLGILYSAPGPYSLQSVASGSTLSSEKRARCPGMVAVKARAMVSSQYWI